MARVKNAEIGQLGGAARNAPDFLPGSFRVVFAGGRLSDAACFYPTTPFVGRQRRQRLSRMRRDNVPECVGQSLPIQQQALLQLGELGLWELNEQKKKCKCSAKSL